MWELDEPDDEFQHIPVHSQCGACGFRFEVDDRLVALLKPNKDDAGIETVDAMTFPRSTYGRIRDQILFCRDIPCRDCQIRTEVATVHADCLHFYLANAPFPDKVRRLWAAAVSRYPWPGSPSLLLCPVLYSGCANRLATALPDLALLATLPVEIAANIWEIAHPSHLSRFGAVLGLVEVLSRAYDDSVTLSLAHVREWRRGSGLYIAADESQSQGHWTWQVEVDCLGIRRIERVDTVLSLQQPDNYRPQSIAFIRTDRDTPVQFQYGMARLAPEPGRIPKQLNIWDIPNPPSVEEWEEEANLSMPFDRLATISTDASLCEGITIFVMYGMTKAIHAHTRAMPCASATFDRLPPAVRRTATWVYVPFSKKDKILSFGVRYRVYRHRGAYCYMIRTQLLGDFTAGPWYDTGWDGMETLMLKTPPGSRVVHTAPENENGLVTFVNVFLEEDRPTDAAPPVPKTDSTLRGACYASALLKEVATLSVYRDRDSWFCTGLLIEYRNGAMRALGNVRPGIDLVEKAADVSGLCFANAELPGRNGPTLQVVKARVSTERGTDATSHPRWKRCCEGDVLEVWFTRLEMVMFRIPPEPADDKPDATSV